MPQVAVLFTMTDMTALSAKSTQTLRFVRRGELVSLSNVPPSRTLLELLRDDLGCTGTKEGCGEGDCGACTVVLGENDGGKLKYRAVNSCIRLAHSIDGLALWTVEDIAEADGSLHPAQQAMVEAHGSQCGFCTPGFVMSLFGMYQRHVAPTLPTACGSLPPEGAAAPADWRSQIRGPGLKGSDSNPITRAMAVEELAGNLCRCTGYQPIFKAAQAMAALPAVAVDEAGVLSKMKLLAPDFIGREHDSAYKLPQNLPDLLAARAAHSDAQLVAGCTDVGLWVTKQHREFDHIIDLTQVAELRRIEPYPNHIAFGAAVPLADAYAALVEDRPQLKAFAARFAGLPVRNSGTLGGNVANGSPIGDSMPLLIAMRASIVLMSVRGHREMAVEDLYTGYRTNVMAADEVLAWVKVPRAARPLPKGKEVISIADGVPALAPSSPAGAAEPALPGRRRSVPSGGSEVHAVTSVGADFLQIYKISKRFDDDISAVCLAIDVRVESGKVMHASIGAGGVAATPVRARKTEAALIGQPWTAATIQQAITTLRAEFSPISDMRASSAYRREVLGNLLQRYWLESQGMQQINLQSFRLEEAA